MTEPHQHRQVAESFGSDAERYDRASAQPSTHWEAASPCTTPPWPSPQREPAATDRCCPFPSLSERVEHLDSGQLKVLDVAGDHGHAVYPRRCCDERVDHREGLRILLTAPGRGDREGDRENSILESGLHIPEPALEGGRLVPVSPAANSRDPLLDLAQSNAAPARAGSRSDAIAAALLQQPRHVRG